MTKRKKQNRQYKVQVLSGAYIGDNYYPVGTIVKVSKEFHGRVIAERNNKLKAL